jgi:predicted metal-dependent hydrolase
LSDSLSEYVRLFNAGEFFEAHEALEQEWHRQKRSNDCLKGLIQLAAAFVHVKKRNWTGAASLLANGRRLIAPFLPVYQGLDLERLDRDAGSAAIAVREGRTEDLRYPVVERKTA